MYDNITVTRTFLIEEHFLFSCSVCPDDVPDGLSAHGTLPRLGPLVDGALEAHAHVATRVEDAVNLTLIADNTLSAGCVAVTWA